MGKIRISARLSEERVLPSECYEPLVEVLNDAVSLTKVRTPIKMNEVDCLYQDIGCDAFSARISSPKSVEDLGANLEHKFD